MLSALSAPVKTLKAHTSLPGDTNASSVDTSGLPVNKLSPVKGFAEMLGDAQVSFLASDDAPPTMQGATEAMPELLNLEQVADNVLPGRPNELAELATAIPIGNALPDIGKTVPADKPVSAGLDINTALDIEEKLNRSEGLDAPYILGLGIPQLEGRSAVDLQISDKQTKTLAKAVIPDAIARINESLQATLKSTSQVLAETKAVAQVIQSGSAPIDSLQSTNTPAPIRIADLLERANMTLENVPKTADGSKQASSNFQVSANRTDSLLTDLQTPTVKPSATDVKPDPLSGAPSELKVAPGKEDLHQRLVGALKNPDESSAPKSANQIPALMAKSVPGSWIQQGDSKVVTADRAAADPLQARVDPQPVNTASMMQRHLEQRLVAQGSEAKRLQAEVAAALDARVSAEGTDRPVAAPAKFDASTSVMPKPAIAPSSAGTPEVSSRQVDTAVQDQILRVMSRQALAQGRLTLQLNPHELGSLDIEFSTEKGEVQVAIVARETSTRDLLEASVARLRQSLQDVGVNVGQLDIRQGDRQSSEQGARGTMHQSMTSETSGSDSKTDEAVSLQRRDDGGIHIYV